MTEPEPQNTKVSFSPAIALEIEPNPFLNWFLFWSREEKNKWRRERYRQKHPYEFGYKLYNLFLLPRHCIICNAVRPKYAKKYCAECRIIVDKAKDKAYMAINRWKYKPTKEEKHEEYEKHKKGYLRRAKKNRLVLLSLGIDKGSVYYWCVTKGVRLFPEIRELHNKQNREFRKRNRDIKP
jgi:hypothetical protein